MLLWRLWAENRWFWIVLCAPVALILLLLLLTRLGAFGKLPTFEELENPKSNLATEIYSDDGEMIGSFFIQNRSYVDYNELSPALVAALREIHYAHDFSFETQNLTSPFPMRIQGDLIRFSYTLGEYLLSDELFTDADALAKY